MHVCLTGGAGLVGQNFVTLVEARPDLEICVIDKHPENLGILKRLHPHVTTILADLAEPGVWESAVARADVVVLLNAQISAVTPEPFIRNNVVATERVLKALGPSSDAYVVHVSSSVVNSVAEDDYSRTKRAQEDIVRNSGIRHTILRPSLMFGWFDPKHLGWLARFMRRSPVFPIPGDGQYVRQPLYVMDFCRVMDVCVERQPVGRAYDLVGPERIPYIDIIRAIRDVQKLRRPIVKIPVGLFGRLLDAYALFDRTPPFTSAQLRALTVGDDFSGIDIESEFGIRVTPFADAMRATLTDARYAHVVLHETT